ncbi:hypothetical protein LSTR_LSTR002731 [Laodelphax striatellus]|uniref:E3 ubiquitin-protein ligase E3D n=1 Tax=Laodelphax striatellus TaxID=195883 RepID=A0A482X5F7_LAOST|nr:hypothetical protein LSTR_LSTR002731 [Laodelphax striatellus]
MIVLIEVNWRLQACQVFILMKKRNVNDSVLLSVTPGSFELSFCKKTFKIEPVQVALKPQTLSGFIAERNNYSFRVNIITKKDFRSSENKAVCYNPKLIKLKATDIACANCGCVVCSNVSFKRILPLPSEGCDLSDFFCHNHGNELNSAQDKLRNISREDCLYGSYYFKINSDYLKGIKCGVVYCRRCLEWLGTKCDESVKLWNCSVNFSDSEMEEKKEPWLDFYNTVLLIANTCVRPLCKVIVRCQITDYSTQYLLLWVMDKNLNVLLYKVSSSSSSCLLEMKVAKVLYVFLEEETALFQEWQNDPCTENIEVSKQMFTDGILSLRLSSRIIPESSNKTNDMHIGYLGIPIDLLKLENL